MNEILLLSDYRYSATSTVCFHFTSCNTG